MLSWRTAVTLGRNILKCAVVTKPTPIVAVWCLWDLANNQWVNSNGTYICYKDYQKGKAAEKRLNSKLNSPKYQLRNFLEG